MKRIIVIFAILLPTLGFSQTSSGRSFADIIEKEKLVNAKLISDIIPWYPTDEYNTSIDYISTKIKKYKAKPYEKNGRKGFKYWWWQTRIGRGQKGELSQKEKNILAKTKAGNMLFIEIKYKYKDAKYEGPEDEHNIITENYLAQVGS